uniref:Uncharacterized protein n=1 Tax=Panagrolaimus sp. PS1159 TaxID=55785 RepID=A0AC35F507_9BILA
MNKIQTIFFSTLFVIILCSFVIVEASASSQQQELNDFQEQLSRFRRFSLPSFPNSKRSDFDDPRFFSSAYGKRSGGRAFSNFDNRQPLYLDGWY